MQKRREELRRGVRGLIEVASREMEALSEEAQPRGPAPDESPAEKPDQPILRLVREPAPRPRPVPMPEPVALQPAGQGTLTSPAAAAGTVPITAAPPPAPATVPVTEPPASTPPAAAPAPAAVLTPKAAPIYGIPADASGVHPRKGVCAAYYINHACWEVPDAYCNQALHVCMLRDCPVYNLNREEMERRFAAKFAHLW
jgi:hypothetical protein